MFGNKLLPHIIYILKKEIQVNNYGEKIIKNEQKIKTNAFINSLKTKILHEKYGIVEDIFYQALIPSNIQIDKTDLIEWNSQQFIIKEILPVLDIKGNIIFYKLLLEKKE